MKKKQKHCVEREAKNKNIRVLKLFNNDSKMCLWNIIKIVVAAVAGTIVISLLFFFFFVVIVFLFFLCNLTTKNIIKTYFKICIQHTHYIRMCVGIIFMYVCIVSIAAT